MPKLYEYVLEIAKEPKYNKMVIYEQEIIAENDTQWVYKFKDTYYIQEKKDKLRARFINDNFFYKIPFYSIHYYTTKLSKASESIVKKALKKLVEETCFIKDIVEQTEINFKVV